MAISKERKEELVAQYKDLIEHSRAIFLAEYGGMSVKDMQTLRGKLREVDAQFYVTKNTLFSLALEESNQPAPADLLIGQVASGFAMGEIPSLAKVLVDYAESEDKLTIKGGIMDNHVLSAAEIEALAKLPSLDQLRAQIIGLISGPARSLVTVLNGSVTQVVNVIDAYAKSEEQAEQVEPEAA